MSQPSNEHANEVFSKLLLQTLPKCCDVVVKHKKTAKKDGTDAKKDGKDSKDAKDAKDANDAKEADNEQDRKLNMLKP